MSVFARFFWVVEIKSIKKFFEKRKGKKKKENNGAVSIRRNGAK